MAAVAAVLVPCASAGWRLRPEPKAEAGSEGRTQLQNSCSSTCAGGAAHCGRVVCGGGGAGAAQRRRLAAALGATAHHLGAAGAGGSRRRVPSGETTAEFFLPPGSPVGGFFHMHMGRALQRWQESAAAGTFVSFQQIAAAGGGRSIGRQRLAAGVGLAFVAGCGFGLSAIGAKSPLSVEPSYRLVTTCRLQSCCHWLHLLHPAGCRAVVIGCICCTLQAAELLSLAASAAREAHERRVTSWKPRTSQVIASTTCSRAWLRQCRRRRTATGWPSSASRACRLCCSRCWAVWRALARPAGCRRCTSSNTLANCGILSVKTSYAARGNHNMVSGKGLLRAVVEPRCSRNAEPSTGLDP